MVPLKKSTLFRLTEHLFSPVARTARHRHCNAAAPPRHPLSGSASTSTREYLPGSLLRSLFACTNDIVIVSEARASQKEKDRQTYYWQLYHSTTSTSHECACATSWIHHHRHTRCYNLQCPDDMAWPPQRYALFLRISLDSLD